MFADRPEVLAPPSAPVLGRIWPVRDLVVGVGALAAITLLLIAALVLLRVRGAAVGMGASVLLELALGGIVLLLAARRGVSLRELGFVRPTPGRLAVPAGLGAYGILVGYVLLLRLAERAGFDVSMFTRGNPVPLSGDEGVALVAVMAVTVVLLAPVCEELFFRALLYRGLRGFWSMPLALAVSGSAFGAFHLNLSVVLPYSLIGMLFAWLMEESRSLWPPIVVHALVNGISFAVSIAALTN